MTITNGANHHNVEELLASIRTSMNGEDGPARLVAGDMHLPVRREQTMAEEAAEFELPAIFKPGHMPAPEKQKLFGRLSDALKSAPVPDGERSRVIPFDPALSSARMLEPPAATHMQANDVPPEPAPEPPSEPVARIMPTFFDTRLNRMGELTRKAFEPEPPPAPEPAPQPPALPAKVSPHQASEGPDDAAAQLLRPMLRAWLQENMPKIVEKALLSEVQGEPPQKPRK